MKKTAAFLLACVMLLATVATAETIYPEYSYSMEGDFADGLYDVGFNLDDVTEKEIFALMYEPLAFDTLTVHDLKVGDEIEAQQEIVIKTLTTDEENVVYINGGYEAEDGLMLVPADEGGMYFAYEYESYVYLLKGQAQLMLADEVVLHYFYEDEDGAIAPDMKTVTVPAAELKATLCECLAGLESYVPGSAEVEIQDQLVVELTIDYAPYI